jgi:hypothetical protein
MDPEKGERTPTATGAKEVHAGWRYVKHVFPDSWKLKHASGATTKLIPTYSVHEVLEHDVRVVMTSRRYAAEAAFLTFRLQRLGPTNYDYGKSVAEAAPYLCGGVCSETSKVGLFAFLSSSSLAMSHYVLPQLRLHSRRTYACKQLAAKCLL